MSTCATRMTTVSRVAAVSWYIGLSESVFAVRQWQLIHGYREPRVPVLQDCATAMIAFFRILWGMALLFVCVASAGAQTIELVNKDFTGTHSANAGVGSFLMADDGKLLAYDSSATNIVTWDTNRVADVFVYDRSLRRIIWNTTDSRWGATNAPQFEGSHLLQLTPDSRYLLFTSSATGFVAGVTVLPVMLGIGAGGNTPYQTFPVQVYVHDLWSNITSIASISADHFSGANSNASSARISSDGRFIAFLSTATNLVAIPGFNGSEPELFCRDQQAGVTEIVSLAPSNDEALDHGLYSNSGFGMSTNGRYFAFVSTATNAVAGHPRTNLNPLIESPLVYWRDRLSGSNVLVSDTLDGVLSPTVSASLRDISPDGRFVCFSTYLTNVVAGVVDTNGSDDLFIRDMQLGTVWMVTRTPDNYAVQGFGGRFSGGGRYLMFGSPSTMLVNGIAKGNTGNDLFVHDILARTNALVTFSLDGTKSASDSTRAANARISDDGRFVLFMNYGTNLIAGTMNRLARFYLRDMAAGQTLNVLRLSPSGPEAGFPDTQYELSGDGRALAFLSATNLDSSVIDTNKFADLFTAAVFPPRILSFEAPGSLKMEGIAFASYTVLASTNLVDWTAITTNESDIQGMATALDPEAAHMTSRFYRVQWK